MKETKTFIKFKNSQKDNFPEWIVVHHSAASENQTVESIENYHLSQGWEGVGYHYLITKEGEIYKGRPEHYHGSHVKEQGMNKKSIGICVIGDFDKKMPTDRQISALKGLLEYVQSSYKIPREKIVPHRHFLGNPPYKTCWGKNLSDTWAQDLLKPLGDYKDTIKEVIRLLQKLL